MTTFDHNTALSEVIGVINKSEAINAELSNILIAAFTTFFKKPLDTYRANFELDKVIDMGFAPLTLYLTASTHNDFIQSVPVIIDIFEFLQEHLGVMRVYCDGVNHYGKRLPEYATYSTTYNEYFSFLSLVLNHFSHLVITLPSFSDEKVQLALFPAVSKSILNRRNDVLFVFWLKRIADTQRQKPLSDDLLQTINHCFTHQYADHIFLYKKERDRALKLLELINSPIDTFYKSKLPIEIIGEQTVISEKVYVAATDWPLKIATDFNALPNDTQNLWREVWQHATTATTAQPSVAWLKQAIPLAESLKPSFSPQLNQWLTTILADVPRKDAPLSQKNAQLVRGLLWFAGLGDVKYFTKLLSSYVKFFYHKVSGLGPRSTIVANAALYSLGQQGVSGVIQLSKLRDEVTYATGQKAIENALTEAAKKAGIDKHNLEEVAVPDFGFDNVGHTKINIGNYELNITLVGEKTVDTCWLNGEKLLKSAPSTLKTTHPTEFKYLKEQLDEIKDVLIGQHKRLEQFYLNQRVWDYSTWRARLIDHPILGWFGRRLIWTFKQSNQIWHGLWLDGKFVNAVGEALPEMNATTHVHLWHPTESDVAEVKNWRDYLLLKQIMQPFKQAFREIYLLTPAEEQTKTYSRRFYQQFLAQKPFAELCLQAGWSYRVQSSWHNQPYATRFSEAFGIGIKLGNSISDYDLEKGMMEVYEYIMLNNVQFYDAKENEVALKDVPVIAAILNLTFHPVFGLAGGIGSKLCSMNAISASQLSKHR